MDQTTALPRPLRRDAEQNRQRILVAAREVFADRGLEASLDDIARHAGLGVGTVYRRFPNKEALIDALFEENYERVLGLARATLGAPDAWSGFVGLIEGLCELQSTDRGLRDIMLSENYGRDRVAQMRDQIKPLFEQIVARAQAEGPLRKDVRAGDMPLLMLMVASAAEFTHDVRTGVWRRYLGILLDGLCERRDAATPLTEEVLEDDDVHRAMHNWPPTRRMANQNQAADSRSRQA